MSAFTPSLFALLSTVAEYLGHAGRTSVEIGLMRFLWRASCAERAVRMARPPRAA